jgi:uncharacterized protein YqeY
MRLITTNELSELTGKTNATVKKRLAELQYTQQGKKRKYDSAEALSILYEVDKPKGEYDLEQERARLASEQADGTALDNEKKRRSLVSLSDALDAVAAEYAVLRRRLLASPDSASTQLINEYSLNQDQQHNIRNIIQDAINEALEDLSCDDLDTLQTKINESENVRTSKKII